MNQAEIRKFMLSKHVKVWNHSLNCARFHNKNETKAHFMSKADLVFEMLKRNHTVFTELEIPRIVPGEIMQRPVCDFFWLEGNCIVEFETNLNPNAVKYKESQYPGFDVFCFLPGTDVDVILKRIGAD